MVHIWRSPRKAEGCQRLSDSHKSGCLCDGKSRARSHVRAMTPRRGQTIPGSHGNLRGSVPLEEPCPRAAGRRHRRKSYAGGGGCCPPVRASGEAHASPLLTASPAGTHALDRRPEGLWVLLPSPFLLVGRTAWCGGGSGAGQQVLVSAFAWAPPNHALVLTPEPSFSPEDWTLSRPIP